FTQIEKMGSISSIIKMLPGANKINEDDIDEMKMVHTKAIIYSMTKKEREKPSIIDAKRKRRIAAGCGLKVEDVNNLLKQFDMMQKMMKQMTSKNGKRRLPRIPMGF
ncbi:MAG: signal recognition particle protein, partial [Ruminiclostridium sp.]|nr:signal recognition particle protein [Ruminiclostridium sp.]